MGFLDAINPIQIALDKVRDSFINPLLSKYGKVDSISLKDKRIYCTIVLKGLENEPFTASCGKLDIADDYSTVKFADFRANKEFLQNVLDDFGSRPIKVPDNAIARGGLKALKAFM